MRPEVVEGTAITHLSLLEPERLLRTLRHPRIQLHLILLRVVVVVFEPFM